MKRILGISALMLATAFSTTAVAGDRDAVVGAMVGGGAGAYIGHSMNGRDGALIGGAIGAITGVALATGGNGRERTVERERVVYEPQPVAYEPQRVVVVQRYVPPRRVVVIDRRFNGYGHHHGWRRAYAYDDHDRGGEGQGYNRGRDDDRGDNRGWDNNRDDDRGNDRGDRWH